MNLADTPQIALGIKLIADPLFDVEVFCLDLQAASLVHGNMKPKNVGFQLSAHGSTWIMDNDDSMFRLRSSLQL